MNNGNHEGNNDLKKGNGCNSPHDECGENRKEENGMGAKNEVIAGDYKGCRVKYEMGDVEINVSLFKDLDINKKTVSSIELQDEEHKKSTASAVGRAAVGALPVGPVGVVAGFTAKSKDKYTVAVYFKNGKKSLLEVDAKLYKKIMENTF